MARVLSLTKVKEEPQWIYGLSSWENNSNLSKHLQRQRYHWPEIDKEFANIQILEVHLVEGLLLIRDFN